MSAKTNKKDYFILGMLGALTAGVLLLLLLWGWLRTDRPESPAIRTTRSVNHDGVIVYYTLLERLGISAERSEKSLVKDTLGPIDVLFMLDPIMPIHSGERNDIQQWLTDGGILICTEIPNGLNPDLDKLIESGIFTNDSGNSKNFDIPDDLRDLPLARDISTLHFETSRVFDSDLIDTGNTIEPLLFDSAGLRTASIQIGEGRIIALADSSFLANGHIGRADNSIMAVNLVAYATGQARGENVMFDEYHLGYGRRDSGFNTLSKMLVTTPVGWALLCLTVAGMLYLLKQGRQFGSRRPLQSGRRRSKLEYVYAVGATYRSAGANQLTLELLFNWTKHKLTNLTGLPPKASNGEIAAMVSGSTSVDKQANKDLLDKCDRLLGQTRLSERQLSSTIKQLAQIEMEVSNEYGKRK